MSKKDLGYSVTMIESVDMTPVYLLAAALAGAMASGLYTSEAAAEEAVKAINTLTKLMEKKKAKKK
jgi:hypothetical protein